MLYYQLERIAEKRLFPMKIGGPVTPLIFHHYKKKGGEKMLKKIKTRIRLIAGCPGGSCIGCPNRHPVTGRCLRL